MATTQGPATQEALTEPSGDHPLWKDVPSWFLIGEQDHIIPRPPALHGRACRRAEHDRDSGRVTRDHRLRKPEATAEMILEAAAVPVAA